MRSVFDQAMTGFRHSDSINMHVVTIDDFSIIMSVSVIENIEVLTGLSRRRSRVRVPSLAPFSLQDLNR